MSLLTDSFLRPYKTKQPNWGFNGLGYIVFKRTYSRPIYDESGVQIRTEAWWETIKRCIDGAQAIGAEYTKEEAEKLFDLVFNLKCNFSGRALWQLGTETVRKFGGNSLLNCWYVSITKPEDFCFVFENLMLGGGVGFSVKREHVHEFPRVKNGVNIHLKDTKDADFIVPDSREGWVSLLRKLLRSFFADGTSFTYSTVLVRGYGEPIKGFGGTASGPKILVEGIQNICAILKARENKKLRSIDALDICNIIGSIVVAGNIRRSAELAIGDSDDVQFLRAKRWDLGTIPSWRGLSNNSIYADEYSDVIHEFWDGYEGNGEPYGLINIKNAQKFGRLGDKVRDNCQGMNPCGEQALADYECCNLAEIYLNNIENEAELLSAAKLLYKVQKAICSLRYIHKETEEIVHKNFRIGMGVTGICQCSEEKIGWLNEAYPRLREFDIEWSKKRGWPVSVKLTTVKPSGTLSLLAGSTPGVHPSYSQYYIRRIQMSVDDALVDVCRKHGYHIEGVLKLDGSIDHKTIVVEFPCEASEGTILSKQLSAVQLMEKVKQLQTVWSDSSVSVTVYYHPDEMPEIKKWLKANYDDGVKSMSFLRHKEHGFKQAPYEEITKERYDDMRKKVKPFIKEENIHGNLLEISECAGGTCPIK